MLHLGWAPAHSACYGVDVWPADATLHVGAVMQRGAESYSPSGGIFSRYEAVTAST